MKVKIEDIKIPAEYCRITLDPDTIELYMENIDKLPPIEINKNNVLINGLHRIHAHKAKGLTEIDAKIIDIPDEQVFIESIKRNRAQGKQLTRYDRQHSATILYKEKGITDLREIADILEVSYDSASRWTRHFRIAEKMERNQKIRDLVKKGKTQEEIAAELGLDQSRISQIINNNCEIISNKTDNNVGASIDDITVDSNDWGPFDNADEIPEPLPVKTDVSVKIEDGCIVCMNCGKKFKLVEVTLEGRVIGHNFLVKKK